MNKDTLRQSVNLLAILATIVVNILANALPFNGLNTGQISDQFKVYFVPAGYVFAIWGLIYLTWLAFGVYQLLPAQRANPRLRRIGYWFALSAVANMAWLFLWHYEYFGLTLLAMFTLLACLIIIYLKLDIGRGPVTAVERWCVDIPFSLYLGWITVATIANVTSVLDYIRWDGWGLAPQLWTLIMLAAGVGIAAAMSLTRRDITYLLVLVWAYVGIAVKHAATPTVATGAWVATLALGGLLLFCLWQMRPGRRLPQPA